MPYIFGFGFTTPCSTRVVEGHDRTPTQSIPNLTSGAVQPQAGSVFLWCT